MLTRKKISVVPIAYKDEGNIEELYKRLKSVLKKITPNYEIVYVLDDNSENSEKILRRLAKNDKRLTVVFHSRNFGLHNAFTTGMKQSTGDAVVIMEGDLQDPPEIIEKFVEKWVQGYDVVYAIKKKREKSMGALRSFMFHLFYLIFAKLSYVKIPLDAGEFSLMDRKVVDVINNLPEKDRYIRGLRAWAGFTQSGIEFIRPERYWGKTTYDSKAYLGFAIKGIFSFSYAPLEFVLITGFIAFILSLLGIVLFFLFYIFNQKMTVELSFLIMVLILLVSVQLFALAIVSQYLKILFEEIKNRPVSVIKEVINDNKK